MNDSVAASWGFAKRFLGLAHHNEGMSSAQVILDRLVREAEADGFVAYGLHVRIGGEVAAHLWSPDERRDIQSIAKAVCVIAVGIAADEGLIEFDAPVSDYLPGFVLGEGSGQVTLRHLLSMTSGVDFPWSETLLTDWPDLAKEFMSRPSRGRVFQYSNASSYTAMRALASVVGDPVEWLKPRLFEPLGIDGVNWERCPNGAIAAGDGLFLTLDELTRIGLLIRDGGAWAGKRLIDRKWIDAMHADWGEHDAEPDYRRYALSGWGRPGAAWRLHGAYGQLLVFLGNAVVTVVAYDHEGADLMSRRIVAALEG